MPTELDTMKHAKEYIDKIANGIDPFTDKPIPDDDIVNNVKLSRCFFYISGILEKVIENGGEVSPVKTVEVVKSGRRGVVVITDEARAAFKCFINEVTPTAFTDMINKHLDPDISGRLKKNAIADWLSEVGMLENYELPNGKMHRRPTESGSNEGIRLSEYFSADGFPRTAIMLSPAAQQFILDNIDAIAEMNGAPRERRKRKPFDVTNGMRDNLSAKEVPMSASAITAEINQYVDAENSGTLKAGIVAKWLENKGMLENTELPNGRKSRLPTDEGLQLGIFTEQRTSMSGDEYTAVLYPPAAQEYIYSHIDEIANLNNG